MRVGLVLAETGDPKAAVNVVNVDEAFIRERTPREGKIGTKSPRVARSPHEPLPSNPLSAKRRGDLSRRPDGEGQFDGATGFASRA